MFQGKFAYMQLHEFTNDIKLTFFFCVWMRLSIQA